MPMAHAGSPHSLAELERRILRQLCSSSIAAEEWNRVTDRLTTRDWSDPEHRVVFEALRAIRSSDPRARREQLPAQATRMGFPDVDWRSYLERDRESGDNLQDLIDRLQQSKQR